MQDGLIPARIARSTSHTTYSDADIGSHREIQSFCVQTSIEKQVQKEDTMRFWQHEEFRPLAAPLPSPEKPTLLSLYTFIRGVMP